MVLLLLRLFYYSEGITEVMVAMVMVAVQTLTGAGLGWGERLQG